MFLLNSSGAFLSALNWDVPSQDLASTQDIRSTAARQQGGWCASNEGFWLPELDVDGMAVKCA